MRMDAAFALVVMSSCWTAAGGFVLSGVRPLAVRPVVALSALPEGDPKRRQFSPRFDGIGIPGTELGVVLWTALRQGGSMATGDLVIAGNDVPTYGIVQYQSYELQRVYYQGERDGRIVQVEVSSLADPAPAGCSEFVKFMVLFSPRYHVESGPVIVRPDEVELVNLRDEVGGSLVLAIPGLFWVGVAYSFWQYGENHPY